jgi:molybdenum cofactor guanylyltransferase
MSVHRGRSKKAGVDPCAAELGFDAAGFVLAGGLSSRMGTDKALAPLCGKPLIEHALAALREAGLPPSIAGARTALGEFAPVISDSAPGQGPLAGICSALASASEGGAVFLSVDLPLVPASLISYLLHRARISGAAVVLASVNAFPQTFPAVVDRAALPFLAAELESGHGGAFSAFQTAAQQLNRPVAVVPAEVIAQSGHASHPLGLPPALSFLNINTPADLSRTERLLATRNRVS